MIVKMKFLSITGPKDHMDRAIDTYLSKYEIQLENALTKLKNVKNLHSGNETNPYKDLLAKASYYQTLMKDAKVTSSPTATTISTADAAKMIQDTEDHMKLLFQEKDELTKKLEENKKLLSGIEKFSELDFDIDTIFAFKFMKYRFGKFTTEYYEKYVKYIDDQVDAIFYKCHTDADYVWGVYFVPASLADKVDAVFSSLHFERIHLDDVYDGTPAHALKLLNEEKKELMDRFEVVTKKINQLIAEHAGDINLACQRLKQYTNNFEIHKYAAYTKKYKDEFFILCGWMTESDAIKLQAEISKDSELFCIFEEGHNDSEDAPPIKLKNPKLVRPFEMFTRMYGLPNYKEFDPTFLIAITYSLIFGAMFGDVGQGLLLVIGGALLYHKKKMNLAACISCCGVFSTFFGFMFGSIFGFEDVLKPLWLRPMKAMTNLPFIGQLNTVFVVAIAFGMFLILMSMVLRIINSIKLKDKETAFFDANGIAGLIFYGALVGMIVLFMTGHHGFGTAVAVIMFGLPLLCIALKEPLGKLIEKKADAMPKKIGMFLVTTFFELFEVLLSYFSNTLSFVRIGAFAVSHAAMMEVVLMLAGAESGSINWIVVVLGNLFVCGLEGLIVGIQVLRLEYYELFSRYYKGDGKEFKPMLPMSQEN